MVQIALRSTAQLISYELILSSAILLIIFFTGSLNITTIIEAQKAIWFIVPLFPVFIIFFIGALAETNRSPMDLAEANFINLPSFSLLQRSLCSPPFYKNTKRKAIFIKHFSSSASSLLLNPNWVSGFTDAEGCFSVKIFKCKSRAFGWRIETCFQISLHKRDKALLIRIKDFFGVGSIYADRNFITFKVSSVKDLISSVIPHFDKFPLITQKHADFDLFKQIVLIRASMRRLSLESFHKILSLRANLNTGWSKEIQEAFPDVTPTPRPAFSLQGIYDPQWLVGFVDGEGCFIINIQNSPSSVVGKIYSKVWLRFFITQHSRDTMLMESITKYLDCGKVSKRSSAPCVDFRVGALDDIITKVIPFFQKYPLQGAKQEDFNDWIKASNLIFNKEHLTTKGLEEINAIKNGMNKKRVHDD